MIGFGQMALMFRQHGRVKALPGARALQFNRGAADLEGAFRSITVAAVLRMLLQMKLPFLLQSALQHVRQAGLEELGQIPR